MGIAVAKAKDSAKSDSKSKSSQKSQDDNASLQGADNALWHSMSTYSPASVAAASQANGDGSNKPVKASASTPKTASLIQRMCAECEQEQQDTETEDIQTKLTIGAPNDPYEQEADAVADRVMRMPDSPADEDFSEQAPSIQTKLQSISPIQRACAACEQEPPVVQRKALLSPIQRLCSGCGNADEDVLQRAKKPSSKKNNLSRVQSVVNSPGQGNSLAHNVRARSESVLNADLSSVRVHSDTRSQQAAQDINARAFTHGKHVYLGAGQSGHDLGLMAHELTHTVQQGASPRLQTKAKVQRKPDSVKPDPVQPGTDSQLKNNNPQEQDKQAVQSKANASPTIQRLEWPELSLPSVDDVIDTASDIADTVYDAGESLVEDAAEVAGEAYDAASEVAGAAYDTAANLAGQAYNAASGIARDVWDEAQALVASFGGSLSLRGGRLVITLPSMPFCPVTKTKLPLPKVEKYVPLIAGGFSVGVVTILGSAGLNFSLKPSLTLVLGPCTLSGVRIVLDPLAGRYSGTGTASVSAAISQLTVARASLLGSVDVIVLVPIGGVPVPIKIPIAQLEGGGQLALRLTGGGTLSSTVTLAYAAGRISLSANPTLALGGAIDLDLAAFARIAALGINLCDFVWPLYHWGASIGRQWSLPLSLSYGLGGAGASVGSVTSTPIPFDDAVKGISRDPPGTDCPIVDKICFVMRALGLLPSQRGVGWTGHPPPLVPTPCNTHPDAPYIEDPLIPSGAKCRGVCGPDCADNCIPEDDMTRCSNSLIGNSHYICEYKGVQNCGTHDGCRHHDACYDWCAAGGSTSIFDSCHRWCDFGCICDNDLNTCIGWALGSPPFDGRMTFYDDTISIMHGPFPGRCPTTTVTNQVVNSIIALGDPALMVSALARLPLQERLYIAGEPAAMQQLQNAIGAALWPVAQRIINGEASVTVPSLDEATWFLADQAIQNGNNQTAFDVVLGTLMNRGLVNGSLANWSHVARADRGEGVTRFNLILDPATGERRAHAPVTVEIYTPAFLDVGWLYSTMMHEYLHVLQVLAGYPATEFNAAGQQRPEFVARDEVESYLWEIEHALGSGLINDVSHMRNVGGRLRNHFNAMTPALQANYQVRYDAAQRRVADVVAGRPVMSIDNARRIVQESSAEIAELMRQRPGNEAAIDAQIEVIRQRRSQAMVEVALTDNPAIQVVQPGDPGVYRAPTVDADGRVRYLHGGIQVAWHMGETSTSAYTHGASLSAGGQMAIAGTAIQGRVHPFPPDVDFDEHIHVIANTREAAGRLAAAQLIANIRRVHGGASPGRNDLEFRHLLSFPHPRGSARGIRMSLGQVLSGGAANRLGRAIAQLNGGNLNTFWRGFLADGRFTDITKVVFVSANRPDGTPLLSANSSDDLNLAFLENPGQVPRTNLGDFAWSMCCAAIDKAGRGNWLKAGKRAYNYFSTIGDAAHMAALEPVFRRPETMVEQHATVIEGIQHVLATRDMGVRQPRTRILTVDEARRQVENVAVIVERDLPYHGVGSRPAAIARDLRILAGFLRARNRRRHLQQDDHLSRSFAREAREIRLVINSGVQGQVQPIIDGVLRPVCPASKC